MVAQHDHPLGLSVLAISAMVEYLFPPFPGDTITLFGAVLITAYGWSFLGVFSSVMLGSVAGAMIDFAVGLRLQRGRQRRRQLSKRDQQVALDRLVDKFRRHGAVYLLLSRFFPGVRALFFVAAGLAGMSTRIVLFYCIVSAAIWNLVIIGVGSVLGVNFDRLVELMRQYSLVVLGGVGLVCLFWVGRWIFRRRC